MTTKQHFNPRSPHGERRVSVSTYTANDDFNPRSPHGERRHAVEVAFQQGGISIHAPRTGSDEDVLFGLFADEEFQSTLPARGATQDVEFLDSAKQDIFQSTLPARGATTGKADSDMQ